MKTNTVPIGYFEVQSDQLVVSDPCYDLDPSWRGMGIIKNPKQGKWYSSIEISDQGSWGKEVAELFACFADLKGKSPWNYFVWEKCNFEVSVDSGQAGIFDLPMFKKDLNESYFRTGDVEYEKKYFEHNLKQSEKALEDLLKNYNKLNQRQKEKFSFIKNTIEENKQVINNLKSQPTTDWYEMCCDKTLSDQRAGTVPGGVVSSSGFGDGGYQAFFAKDDFGKVIAIKIIFISEKDMENEDVDWEEENE